MSNENTDEEIARKMQEEEIAGYTREVGLSEAEAAQINPLLERVRRGDGRTVQRNAITDLSEARDGSTRLLKFYFTWAVLEMIAATAVLISEWDKPCDKPLKWWLIGFSGRYIFFIPVQYMLYLRRRQGAAEHTFDNLTKFKTWLTMATFIWFVVGQTWVYSSETCQNTARPLYITSLVLILFFYVALALPLLIVVGVCLCFPCILLAHRYFSDPLGATQETIRRLPTRTFEGHPPRPVPDEEGKEADEEACAVCMENYKRGDKLRALPCHHEFHVPCIDRWLELRDTCPLCRAKISSDSSTSSSSSSSSSSENVPLTSAREDNYGHSIV